MSLTDVQKIRAARALLDMTQRQLAEAADIGVNTVSTFENGHHLMQANNMAAVWRVLHERGVRFTDVSVSLDTRENLQPSDVPTLPQQETDHGRPDPDASSDDGAAPGPAGGEREFLHGYRRHG